MPDILHEVPIAGTPEKIYQALTEQSGLRAWWTEQASAQAKADTVSEFQFYGGQIKMQIKVDEISSNHIAWSPQAGVPDWPGTRITWDISSDDNGGTKLLFGHRNFPSYDGSFAYTNFNWGWYLSSLKSYIETGMGKPHTGAPGT